MIVECRFVCICALLQCDAFPQKNNINNKITITIPNHAKKLSSPLEILHITIIQQNTHHLQTKLHLNPDFFDFNLQSGGQGLCVFFSSKLQKARAITFLQFTVPKKIAFALAVKSALIYRFRKIVLLALKTLCCSKTYIK